jgi:nicotinate-nucleotide adenylyltransferase
MPSDARTAGGGARRIGVFGGSFDPPHLGHVLAACWAMTTVALDEIWVEPVRSHPYAKDLSPWERRLTLCRLAFADLPSVTVREDERDNPGGYTVDLLRLLAGRRPDTTWIIIGGSDTVTDLANWKDGDALATMADLLVIPRRGQGGEEPALPDISSTAVRSLLARGMDASKFLPRKVMDEITRHGWYQDGGS